jgi:hypothetical protein
MSGSIGTQEGPFTTKRIGPASVGLESLDIPMQREWTEFADSMPRVQTGSIEPWIFEIGGQTQLAEIRQAGRVGQLDGLERIYVIDDRSSVLSFIERNRLRDLLLEAKTPLGGAFGNLSTINTLRLVRDDEGFDTLFCVVQFRGTVEAGMQALASFDEQWWLSRSHQCEGKLNFDFEFL